MKDGHGVYFRENRRQCLLFVGGFILESELVSETFRLFYFPLCSIRAVFARLLLSREPGHKPFEYDPLLCQDESKSSGVQYWVTKSLAGLDLSR